MDQVTAAVQPFIPDHGQQFAHHLLDFLASKLSIAGYDRLMFGEAASPSHALLPSSPGAPLSAKYAPVCIWCLCTQVQWTFTGVDGCVTTIYNASTCDRPSQRSG